MCYSFRTRSPPAINLAAQTEAQGQSKNVCRYFGDLQFFPIRAPVAQLDIHGLDYQIVLHSRRSCHQSSPRSAVGRRQSPKDPAAESALGVVFQSLIVAQTLD